MTLGGGAWRALAGAAVGICLAAQVTASAFADTAAPNAALRRLTRVEYANALRDLFGIEFPVAGELPADGQAEGFDNIGDALSLSPVLLDSYLKVARKATDLIVGHVGTAAVIEQFPATGTQSEWQEGLPIGTRGGVRVDHYFPRTGEYELRAFLDNGFAMIDGVLVRFVSTPTEGVRFFRKRVTVPAGLHRFIVTFPDDHSEMEGSIPSLEGPGGRMGGPLDVRGLAILPSLEFWLDGKRIQSFGIHGPAIGEAALGALVGAPSLSRAEISGPFDAAPITATAVKKRIFTCEPKKPSEEKACATKILAAVARRAYRREITDADLAPLLAAVSLQRKTADFDTSIGMGLQEILTSPDFLYRVETDPSTAGDGASYRISDYEMATRLSFFLWSSIPDDELLNEAKRGGLKQRAGLERQVRRMLADPRADALVDNFGFQWLGLRDLASTRPDPKDYPEYDSALGENFATETRLLLHDIMLSNRSVLDVISSKYDYLNDRLARLYGIPGVEGSAFRKVELPADKMRGGVISQGSVLLVTSHAATTSPVLRGKWILANLLNAPPPAPPPGVPPLDVKPAADGRILTVREQMERHRISPVCITCHVKMDPYGYSLENYDVIGRWRTEDNGNPIDASAELPRTKPFSGPAGLKDLLLEKSEAFATATVSRLMVYALGRKLERSDAAAVAEIVHAAAPRNYRFADLVIGIVNSVPFEMREKS